MDKRLTRFLVSIVLISALSFSFLSAADTDPWYVGKRIASFSNSGLQNVKESVVLDIQYKYLGKPFSDELFNELQGELYGLEHFLYFLADARRTGEGDNELQIAMTFYELPYIKTTTIEGNQGIKTKDITEVLLAKEGLFIDEQNIELSKQKILALYQEKGYADAQVESEYVIDEATNTADLKYIIRENQQKRIGQIVFEGNEKLSSDMLSKQLSSKQVSYFNSGYYNPSTIETDKQKIITFYQSRGYIDAAITDVRTEDISTEDDTYTRLRVVFTIEEGEQWFFGGIEVEGNTVFSDEQFQSLISMRKG
ncbi:MAG: POTRA domain-containing protein, partial [Sphaerochaeta sp.]